MNYCPVCGTKIEEGAIFCLECGLELKKFENNMDNPTSDKKLMGVEYEPIEPEGSPPFLPKNIVNLFINPKKFFTEQVAFGKTPYMILVTMCYGMANVIDRIDQNILKSELGASSALSNDLYINIASSWVPFWAVVIILGGVSAFFLWWLGGWWYTLRIKWSAAENPDSYKSRLIYVYSSFILAGPTVLLVIIQTFIYDNYIEAFNAETYWTPFYLLLPFWSVFVSYKGVISVFEVNRFKAKLWFLILPTFFYLIAMGALAYLLSMSS